MIKEWFRRINMSVVYHGTTLSNGLWDIRNKKLKSSYINEGKWISFALKLGYYSRRNNMPGTPYKKELTKSGVG
jgi:hypothetical protein